MYDEAISPAVADQTLCHVNIRWAVHFETIAVPHTFDFDIACVNTDSRGVGPAQTHQGRVQVPPVLICRDPWTP